MPAAGCGCIADMMLLPLAAATLSASTMAAAAALSAPPPGIAALMQAPMTASLEQYEGAKPRAWTSRGMELFKRGRLSESVAAFDRVIELAPAQKPYMWQRGLSLYYLERQGEAAMQFEIDVAVNPNDTEESIWRWLAQVRHHRQGGGLPAAAIAAARTDLLKLGRDSRPVMRAAMELFAGTGGSVAALDVAGGARGGAASASASSGEQARVGRQQGHNRFYADLCVFRTRVARALLSWPSNSCTNLVRRHRRVNIGTAAQTHLPPGYTAAWAHQVLGPCYRSRSCSSVLIPPGAFSQLPRAVARGHGRG